MVFGRSLRGRGWAGASSWHCASIWSFTVIILNVY